jgi:cyclopropane fatty-acyl-phospholipid synthase-like methyltransferase
MGKGSKGKGRGKPKKGKRVVRDRHLLYEASVQAPEVDLDFFQRVYKRKRGKPFTFLREDFCGTSVMACQWVKRRKANRALGIDIHQPTLDWALEHNVARLGTARERLVLSCSDVREVTEPKADVVAALNFSYGVFKTRDDVRGYFEVVRRSLAPGGIFFVDAFGGMESMSEIEEDREVETTRTFDGTKVPRFTYIWEQKRFNIVDHRIKCFIHFELRDGTRIRRAFEYDWRMWTLPELQELMLEAGFASAEVYLEGWDDEADDTDGIFRRRKYFQNQDGWVGYVVGLS